MQQKVPAFTIISLIDVPWWRLFECESGDLLFLPERTGVVSPGSGTGLARSASRNWKPLFQLSKT